MAKQGLGASLLLLRDYVVLSQLPDLLRILAPGQRVFTVGAPRMEKETLHEGRYLRLVRSNDWEYVERTGTSQVVMILAITGDDKVLFVEQVRRSIGKPIIELPAGLVGDIPGEETESLATAAYRELVEETGYEAQEMELLTSGPPSPGLSAEMVHVFLARGLRKIGTGGGDATEDITVHEVAMTQVVSWLEAKTTEGRIVDPKVYTGLFYAILERDKAVLDRVPVPESQHI